MKRNYYVQFDDESVYQAVESHFGCFKTVEQAIEETQLNEKVDTKFKVIDVTGHVYHDGIVGQDFDFEAHGR